MRSSPHAGSAFLFSIDCEGELSSQSVAQEKERGRACAANLKQERGAAHEVWKNHQRQSTEHHLPELHSFSINECDKTDRAENEIADQERAIELEHAVLEQLEPRQDAGGSAVPSGDVN